MTKLTYIIAMVLLSTIAIPSAMAAVPSALDVTRDISDQTVEQGSTFTVTVTLTAYDDIWVPALDEDLPDGWTVAEVDSAGALYKASTNEWVWLSAMPAGDSETVIYEVTVPADALLQDYEITGEAYAVSGAPVIVGGKSTVTVVAPPAIAVIRAISEQTVEQGSTFTVTLTLTANEDVWVPALDEDLPDGWTVAEVDSAGALYKASTNEWVWLSAMPAGDSETVIYEVTVPADAVLQDYEITGEASAFCVDPVNIGGESTVTAIGGEVEATCDIVINEFVSANATEWVELYNRGETAVDLTGWTLEDGGSHVKPLSGTIPADGYLVFSGYSSWLNNGGDIIYLNSTTANIDRVTYGNWNDGDSDDNAPAPDSDESAGRCPNGGDTDNDADDFRIFEIPTGGIENDCDYV